ncbi:hypothetical protein OESDEN_05026 [Oesophagostomum dentatum]|uniref:Uncharacterized protein n=1 Tax=Oesophagostomum dentatum TaxID=61180 RepID=A0A0B1TFZ8_OESDE|nr:hypothetical protein OESDEN_05026 [Oesophagostomum dentatum]
MHSANDHSNVSPSEPPVTTAICPTTSVSSTTTSAQVSSASSVVPSSIPPPSAASTAVDNTAIVTSHPSTAQLAPNPATDVSAAITSTVPASADNRPEQPSVEMEVDVEPVQHPPSVFNNRSSSDLNLLLNTVHVPVGSSVRHNTHSADNIQRQQIQHPPALDSYAQPPHCGHRPLTPFEACAAFVHSRFEPLDIPPETNANPPRFAIPTYARASLRLAQTLTEMSTFELTFNNSALSARDIMMVDALLHDDFFMQFRISAISELCVPTSQSATYPVMTDHPIADVVTALRRLHEATVRLNDYRTKLFDEPEHWHTLSSTIDSLDTLGILQEDLEQCRALLDTHLTPAIASMPDDIANFMDMLDLHNATPLKILFFYNVATAELAFAYNTHQALTDRLRVLCATPSAESSNSSTPAPATPTTAHEATATSPDITDPIKTLSLSHEPRTVIPADQASSSAQPLPPQITQVAHPEAATADTVAPASTATTSPATSVPSTAAALSSSQSSLTAQQPTLSTKPSDAYFRPTSSQSGPSVSTAQSRSATNIPTTSSHAASSAPSQIVRNSGAIVGNAPPLNFPGCLLCGANHYSAECDVVSLRERCERVTYDENYTNFEAIDVE